MKTHDRKKHSWNFGNGDFDRDFVLLCRQADEYVDSERDYVVKRVYDPWEGCNRNMHKFNAKFDQ